MTTNDRPGKFSRTEAEIWASIANQMGPRAAADLSRRLDRSIDRAIDRALRDRGLRAARADVDRGLVPHG